MRVARRFPARPRFASLGLPRPAAGRRGGSREESVKPAKPERARASPAGASRRGRFSRVSCALDARGRAAPTRSPAPEGDPAQAGRARMERGAEEKGRRADKEKIRCDVGNRVPRDASPWPGQGGSGNHGAGRPHGSQDAPEEGRPCAVRRGACNARWCRERPRRVTAEGVLVSPSLRRSSGCRLR